MKYAIVQIAGHQYQVEKGQELTVDSIDQEVGKKFDVTDVLLTVDGDKRTIGTPFIDKAKVSLEVIEHGRAPKIRVATYKAKSRQRKVHGHKQPLTTVKVTAISG